MDQRRWRRGRRRRGKSGSGREREPQMRADRQAALLRLGAICRRRHFDPRRRRRQRRGRIGNVHRSHQKILAASITSAVHFRLLRTNYSTLSFNCHLLGLNSNFSSNSF